MKERRLDPRLNAVRDDLAAADLKGIVEVPRFVEGRPKQVVQASAPLRSAPRHDARLDSEVLLGERIELFDEREGWSWVQVERDGYVGYVPSEALAEAGTTPTHRIAVLASHLYPAPDIKAPPVMRLGLNAAVTVIGEGERFAHLASGDFIPKGHLVPRDVFEADFVAVAERFLGTPYLWGGRTDCGIDCSGLVQIALQAAGEPCPRDSDMIENALGEPLPHADGLPALERGDLVFWEGHVGIMVDGARLLHASSHHMQTVIEPLAPAMERIAPIRGAVTSLRRLPS